MLAAVFELMNEPLLLHIDFSLEAGVGDGASPHSTDQPEKVTLPPPQLESWLSLCGLVEEWPEEVGKWTN